MHLQMITHGNNYVRLGCLKWLQSLVGCWMICWMITSRHDSIGRACHCSALAMPVAIINWTLISKEESASQCHVTFGSTYLVRIRCGAGCACTLMNIQTSLKHSKLESKSGSGTWSITDIRQPADIDLRHVRCSSCTWHVVGCLPRIIRGTQIHQYLQIRRMRMYRYECYFLRLVIIIYQLIPCWSCNCDPKFIFSNVRTWCTVNSFQLR